MTKTSKKVEKYETQLKATKAFLRKPRTAAEVAARFGISRFAAYERLNQLATRGELACTGIVEGPKGRTGPKAHTWKAS